MKKRKKKLKKNPLRKYLVLFFSTLTIFFGSGLFLSNEGVLEYFERKDLLLKISQENFQLTQEYEALQSETERLKNDSYVEQVARESLGMLKANEIFIVVDPPETKKISNN